MSAFAFFSLPFCNTIICFPFFPPSKHLSILIIYFLLLERTEVVWSYLEACALSGGFMYPLFFVASNGSASQPKRACNLESWATPHELLRFATTKISYCSYTQWSIADLTERCACRETGSSGSESLDRKFRTSELTFLEVVQRRRVCLQPLPIGPPPLHPWFERSGRGQLSAPPPPSHPPP